MKMFDSLIIKYKPIKIKQSPKINIGFRIPNCKQNTKK